MKPSAPPRATVPAAAREGLRESRRFLDLLLRKTGRDGIFRQASALAFDTMLSLVPLLAAFSFVGKRFFDRYRERVVDALAQILPYGEATIRARLNEFLVQADTLPQFGLVGFMVVSLFAFGTIEETLNVIWGVSARRPFRLRLLSFTLLIFWGPLLIGAVFSALLLFGQNPEFQVLLEEAVVLQLAPFLAVLVGLTMLYWLVPYAEVRFRAAFAGGLVAAVLFELLRLGFGLYVDAFGGTSDIIYGGFALVLFFMVSIQAAWVIALLGSEVSYLAQHFHRWSDPAVVHAPPREAWTGVVALAAIAERFLHGEPLTSAHQLANLLLLPPSLVRRALEPLVEGRLLVHPDATAESYVLAADPHRLALHQVFALYDEERGNLLDPLPEPLAERLAGLRDRLRQARRDGLENRTLAELVEAASAVPVSR